MVKAKKIVYANVFDGEPKVSDFRLEIEDLGDELRDGDVLAEAVYLSIDPYMRVQMPDLPINTPMIGEQIARIIDSKDEKYPVGSFIWAYFGWRDYTIFNNSKNAQNKESIAPYILSPMKNISLSTRLGALGMTGMSAYFGFLELCHPKENETVVITGAAGAVGNIVGQIAKIKKCFVIGLTGSEEKCRWLKEELKFDHVINYKCENIDKALESAAPNGVDCFFDNVGGEVSSKIMSLMNNFGRVAVCGSISTYNSKNETLKATIIQPIVIAKQLKIEGFIVSRWFHRWHEGMDKLQKWIEDGQLIYRETITDGFDNMPTAFIGMLRGDNIGKALVRV